ncbi:hypothetical protein RJ55_03346 [Drechmeria coniospora]|nr:hypothetical protein RJ55_03346 [Drechmeria coniospora]
MRRSIPLLHHTCLLPLGFCSPAAVSRPVVDDASASFAHLLFLPGLLLEPKPKPKPKVKAKLPHENIMSSPLRLLVLAAAAAAPAVTALYVNGSTVVPCDSPIYCHGDILREVELARPFSDSKTFVDMPAIRPLDVIRAAFDKLHKPLKNDSALHEFLKTHFADAGGELKEVPRSKLTTDAVFLRGIEDVDIREFTAKVIDIWPSLTREYAGSRPDCPDCPSSFIPVKKPFVVAGGRFREPYYWDSYWILEGLLRTRGSFTDIARNTIENFLDLIEQFGFIPNGARIYYLNRSQPPMLAQMIGLYLEHTNDKSILDRALPLLVREHDFWLQNRTVEIRRAGSTYHLARYAVRNTQPRPESFREDYNQATNASFHATSRIVYPQVAALDEEQQEQLYGNLAAAAETGWDFSSRWLANPSDSARDVYFPLRSLNTENIVPVCLNSILYGNERVIGDFFALGGNDTARDLWHARADARSEAMTALLWNETHFSYFDYNITAAAQNIYVPFDDHVDSCADPCAAAKAGNKVIFHSAQLFPFWQGAAPARLKHNPLAVKRAYARVADHLDSKAGGVPATNIRTDQQWDEPAVWAPLMHAMMQGLLSTPPTFGCDDPAYRDVRALALALAQRYLDSTFCTWYATGGSTSATDKLPWLTDKDVGVMFEKYNDDSTNVAGGGGEYEVVEGFGWTNGVLIWAVDTFGNDLKRPDCGDIKPTLHDAGKKRSAVELHASDASRVKKFGSRALR